MKKGLYIDSREFAAFVGWQPRRVQRLWRGVGIAMKRGRSIVTTFNRFAVAFPDEAEAIAEKLGRAQ